MHLYIKWSLRRCTFQTRLLIVPANFTERQGLLSNDDASLHSDERLGAQVGIEGEGTLWEGKLPGEFRVPSRAELNEAVRQLGGQPPTSAPTSSPAPAPTSAPTSAVVPASGQEPEPAMDAAAAAQQPPAPPPPPPMHPMVPAFAGRLQLAQPLLRLLERTGSSEREGRWAQKQWTHVLLHNLPVLSLSSPCNSTCHFCGTSMLWIPGHSLRQIEPL